MRRCLPLLLLLAVSACASHGSGGRDLGDYVGGSVSVECAPFARALTGVALWGDAADWWSQSAGRYRRGEAPSVGSLLVFRRSSRLPSGHVSVVSRVLGAREILVTQANWVHHRVTEDQPVIDISPANDWSEVRVWWPPSGQMGGGEYATYGFIRPNRPTSHDALMAATPGAVRLAEAASP